MRGDGDGWLECGRGHRHWGRFGAAGLLLYTAVAGEAYVLLQHRALWCHHGNTWGIPGGARDSHETAVAAALREADEEAGIDAELVTVHRELVDDHQGWKYTSVIAHADKKIDTVANRESLALVWQPVSDTEGLDLHPGFAATWPAAQARQVRLLVDTANVIGSRPNGWWRDRPGATTSELQRLAGLVTRLVVLPSGADAVVVAVTAVLEGEARGADTVPGVETVRATGSGDDTLVALAEHAAGQEVLVVTADRELRGRLPPTTGVVGPSWLSARPAG